MSKLGGNGKPRPKTGGRKAGTPNKLPAAIKAMIEGALSDVGGQAYLARQAEENPVAFMGLVGKVLPLQITGDKANPIEHRHEVIRRVVFDPKA